MVSYTSKTVECLGCSREVDASLLTSHEKTCVPYLNRQIEMLQEDRRQFRDGMHRLEDENAELEDSLAALEDENHQLDRLNAAFIVEGDIYRREHRRFVQILNGIGKSAQHLSSRIDTLRDLFSVSRNLHREIDKKRDSVIPDVTDDLDHVEDSQSGCS